MGWDYKHPFGDYIIIISFFFSHLESKKVRTLNHLFFDSLMYTVSWLSTYLSVKMFEKNRELLRSLIVRLKLISCYL